MAFSPLALTCVRSPIKPLDPWTLRQWWVALAMPKKFVLFCCSDDTDLESTQGGRTKNSDGERTLHKLTGSEAYLRCPCRHICKGTLVWSGKLTPQGKFRSECLTLFHKNAKKKTCISYLPCFNIPWILLFSKSKTTHKRCNEDWKFLSDTFLCKPNLSANYHVNSVYRLFCRWIF